MENSEDQETGGVATPGLPMDDTKDEDIKTYEEEFKKPKSLIGQNRGRSLLLRYLQQKELTQGRLVSAKNEVDDQGTVPVEDSGKETKENGAKNLQEVRNEVTSEQVSFPYNEPAWGGLPDRNYSLEELKSGVIERTLDLMQRPFSVFGRMDGCHVTMAHPSVSRYHAVLQFRMESDDTEDRGFYIYDLGSTHGTFVNKYRVKHKVYTRVRVGHILKIGCSSRLFILKGPPEDEEVESELTVTELKERRRLQEEERKVKKEQAEMEAKLEEEKKQKLIEERGIDWGMSEDADEETDLSENPYAVTTNEELYIDDPKKTLRGWFEREGEELTYDVQKADKGMFVCKIVLPLDSETGRDIVVEISGKSKKEAIVKCALEACRHIDRLGLLRQSHHESRKRQVKNWEENDYYDSDEDNFLDRTGQIEKKREKRMKKLGKIQESVETYQSLLEKHREVVDRLQKAEDKLYLLKTAAKEELIDADTEVDALDAFMKNLSQNKKRDKLEIKLCRQNIEELKKEEAKLIHFVNLAKPANLPDLKPFVLKKPAVKVDCSLPSVIKASDQENVTAIMQETIEPPEIEDCETKSLEKNVKYIGPQKPNEQDLAIQAKKKKRSRQRIQKSQKPEKPQNYNYDDDDEDFNNCVWMPPKGQTGDGRTSLNEKLGY